jgi:hypothetical protein
MRLWLQSWYNYFMELKTLIYLSENKLTVKDILSNHSHLILEAYETSRSYSDLLNKLNINVTNTRARETLKVFLSENGLEPLEYSADPDKMRNRLTKEEVLERFIKSDRHYGTSLRGWVIKYDLLPYHCFTEDCPLHENNTLEWMGKPITLDLDHINGDNRDNRLANLRFLCPNCHSQTETYKGLNNRRSSSSTEPKPKRITSKVKEKMTCPECGGQKSVRSLTCEKCYRQPQKALYPPLDALLVSIGEKGFEAVGRDLGLSGNALRKHLRRNNVDPKSLSPFASGPKSVG